MKTATRPPPAAGRQSSNGTHRAPVPTVRAPRRRVQFPMVVLGLGLVVLMMLVAAVVYVHGTSRKSVIAMQRDVSAGQILKASDFQTVNVSTDGNVQLVLDTEESGLVGRPAAVPLRAGSILSRSQVGVPSGAAPGTVVIGLLCKPGQYPPSIMSGQRAGIYVSSVGPGGAAPAASGGAIPTAAIPATVLAVDQPPDLASSGVVLTLSVPADSAAAVASASRSGQITIVLLPSGS